MTDTPLKSCYSCEHCNDSNYFLPTCKKYTFTVDNYLYGTSTKHEYWCLDARENAKKCGPEAVGHEPRTSGIDILKTVWAFIRTFLPTAK